MGRTSIEWTDATWNPVRGCTKVSPGCKHCYAETFAERFRGVPGHPYEQGFDLRLVPEKLQEPLSWREPQRVFVNSMSDLFHPDVPNEYIAACVAVMAGAKRHTFQVLTKRAERLPKWFAWLDKAQRGYAHGRLGVCAEHLAANAGEEVSERAWRSQILEHHGPGAPTSIGDATAWPWPLPNVWLGVSVEDRKYGLPRIAHLRQTPAAVRVLSIEPLLEDLGTLDLRGIHQVIVGGESGPGARPMHPDWVRSIRDQCTAAGVAFFFKQWGGVRKKTTGRILDARTWDEMPEVARG
ncbi:phage Gp37/Gp68 family protein [Corallococcus coralloides]|nr:phage Gp37/Gp68 family protein [Corallococcus coralloides]